MMQQYECLSNVEGRRTKEIVSAPCQSDAKKIIEARYKGCKISWVSCTMLR